MEDLNHTHIELPGHREESPSFGVTVNLASPEVIRSWSHGEVWNPESIYYRTGKPEKYGLFCEKIFGPVNDWECSCGKYKSVDYRGKVCEICGVEVTLSSVRRERMGHIDLAVPVSHIWYANSISSHIGFMLNRDYSSFERVIYYEDWIVTDPGDTPLKLGQRLSEFNYRDARKDYGGNFKAHMGAPAIKKLLEKINLESLVKELEEEVDSTRSSIIRASYAKRIRSAEGFLKSNTRPEWMILEVIPVLPPALRPMETLEDGRFITSDLNELYQRIIKINNKLKNHLKFGASEVIIRNLKRALQKSVDALFDNRCQDRAVTDSVNRPLKSLSDVVSSNQVGFQNLLGKHVDYSGRSVIVVDPELTMGQCGIPKEMALVLFETFIISKLKQRGYVHTVRSAIRMIERGEQVVWDILNEVTKEHQVILNRAPTLHRLNVQAFAPILVEGAAIRINPLVFKGFHADFDGDQMAVHIPLSSAAQLEAKLLMHAPNNIFSPANGKPITTPTQDIALGLYYLTVNPRNVEKAKYFINYFEVMSALDSGCIKVQDAIMFPNPDLARKTIFGDSESKYILTTPGRCIFNQILDKSLGFFNNVADKNCVENLITQTYTIFGRENTVELLEALKRLGFEYVTRAAFSISLTDMIIPENKQKHIDDARKEIDKFDAQFQRGIITAADRHRKLIYVWTHASNRIANELINSLDFSRDRSRAGEINPIFAILDSGVQVSMDQLRQLGICGLVEKPSGYIIERPILSNYREGLSANDYFISAQAARRGNLEKDLQTADSFIFLRNLVHASQDVICHEEDCGTVKGIWVSNILEDDEEIVSLRDRIIGRFSAQDIRDPAKGDGSMLVTAFEEITEQIAARIVDSGIKSIYIRSPLTCETEFGVCVKCYGRNLANHRLANVGDALGIIAAQSIGERAFDIRETASLRFKPFFIKAPDAGVVKFLDTNIITNDNGQAFVVNMNGFVVIEDDNGVEFYRKKLPKGAILAKTEGEKVLPNDMIASWDPFNMPVIAEKSGVVEFRDLIEGVTLNREISSNGLEYVTIMGHHEYLYPHIVVKNDNDEIVSSYMLPPGASLMISEGVKVNPGTFLAKTPRQTSQYMHIFRGLPRIVELLEARIPRFIAEIARIDGRIELGKMSRGRRQLIICDVENNQSEEHLIPANKQLLVGNGDIVYKGQTLTEGSIVPHELLEICGPQQLLEYIVKEVQLVYRAHGIEINDKHIEVIVRQMLQKVRITDPGKTKFLIGEQINKYTFLYENWEVASKGGKPAEAETLLFGITKASLETDSFISAASFQDTVKILKDATAFGKIDYIRGLKENIISGHLIPAGTGAEDVQKLHINKLAVDLPPEEPPPKLKSSRAVRFEGMYDEAAESAAIDAARKMLSKKD